MQLSWSLLSDSWTKVSTDYEWGSEEIYIVGQEEYGLVSAEGVFP